MEDRTKASIQMIAEYDGDISTLYGNSPEDFTSKKTW